MTHKIAIVDDHLLFTRALSDMINEFDGFEVTLRAGNGQEFIQEISTCKSLPDVVILDLNMPIMDGFETLNWIQENQPQLKVLILSMNDDEMSIIKCIRNGANGYLLKNITPSTLQQAFKSLIETGFYHSEIVNHALLQNVYHKQKDLMDELKTNEVKLLKLVCSEKTYKEIADDMCLSPKTIDGYRQSLFEKLNVKSRVGLVLFAMENKIFEQ